MEKSLIKPYAKMKWEDTAEIYIEGPIQEISIAEFNFKKEVIRIYHPLTQLLLIQLYNMYGDLLKVYKKKEAKDESESSNEDS